MAPPLDGKCIPLLPLVFDDDNEEEEDLPKPQGLNKREKPTPMQEGPSGEDDLPEVQCLKGKRPTPTQLQKSGSHAEVVVVDDVSEPAASSSKWSSTGWYTSTLLYSLPSL